jgi:uncharacterized protein (DUF849 family)
VRIKACLNGRRAASAHPGVPVTATQLALAARVSVAAGAQALHIHPRAADGQESLLARDVGAAVAAVRTACPGTPVGVTTAQWAAPGPAARQRLVAAWSDLDDRQRPDFASVNVSEEGWRELAAALAAAGIGAEAGVWSISDAEAVARFEPASGWLRTLVEVSGVPAAEAVSYADGILGRLDRDPVILLHGEDESCWPLVAHAGRLGLPTRIGLEDVLTGPAGEPVSGNAELVQIALRVWAEAAGG